MEHCEFFVNRPHQGCQMAETVSGQNFGGSRPNSAKQSCCIFGQIRPNELLKQPNFGQLFETIFCNNCSNCLQRYFSLQYRRILYRSILLSSTEEYCMLVGLKSLYLMARSQQTQSNSGQEYCSTKRHQGAPPSVNWQCMHYHVYRHQSAMLWWKEFFRL